LGKVLQNVTLHQLRVFEAVARHKSFTRAAEELFLTQPTVSMQVKQLTRSVGLPLFEQLGKRLYLTDTGQALFKTCQETFERLAQFEMTLADMRGLKHGYLRLAVVTTAKYFAPRLLGPFCQRYPGIEVSLKVTNHEYLLERLSNNEDDLYIMSQPPTHREVESHPFVDNPLVVLAPWSHPLAGKKQIPLTDLAQEPFIMREAGSGTRAAVQKRFREQEVPIHVKLELGSNEAIKQAIVGGLGISVLSLHTLALVVPSHQLAILDVQGFPIRLHWHLAYSAGKQLSVVASAFLDYLQTEGKQMAQELTTKWKVDDDSLKQL